MSDLEYEGDEVKYEENYDVYYSLANKIITLLIKIGRYENIAKDYLNNKKLIKTLKYYYNKLVELDKILETSSSYETLTKINKEIEKIKPKIKKIKIFYKLF